MLSDTIDNEYKFPVWIFIYILFVSTFGYGGILEILDDVTIGPFFFRPIDIIFFSVIITMGFFLFKKKQGEFSKLYISGIILSIYFTLNYLLADKSKAGSMGIIVGLFSFWILIYISRSQLKFKDIFKLDIIAQLGLLIFFFVYLKNLTILSKRDLDFSYDFSYLSLRLEATTRRAGLILQFFPVLALGFSLGALLLTKLTTRGKIIRIFLIIIFLLSLDISLRGNYIFLIGLFIFTYLFMKHRGVKFVSPKIILLISVTLLVLFATLQLAGHYFFNVDDLLGSQFSRVTGVFTQAKEGNWENATESRNFYWLYGLQMITNDFSHLLFGYGFLLFQEMSPVFVLQPHNFFIESVLVYGLVGWIILFIFIWLPIIKRAVKMEKIVRNYDYWDVLTYAIYVVLLKFFVVQFTQAVTFERDVMIFFYACCGILFALNESSNFKNTI
jgi:hypothetical protein